MNAKIFSSVAMATITGLFALAIFSPKFANAQEPPSPQNPQVNAQPTEADEVLPPDVQSNEVLSEVIRLTQSGVSEDVITNYIANVQYRFNLTAGDIIYLRDIGVPDSMVLAMQQRDQQLGETVSPPPQSAPAPPPATTAVTEDYFYDNLAPYGSWVVVEGYGRCWRPSVVVYNHDWQPYCDGGHWVWTDAGWYWYSDYSWGWAPFHYGRWFRDARFGWCWYPDTVWGPSWVSWRYSDDYCGWAPLPPHCEYREGIGLFFNGSRVSVGFDFGLAIGAFTFVATHDFCDPHPWRHRVDHDHVTQIYNRTTVINNITVNNNGGHNTTIINNGIPHDHIAAVAGRPVPQVHIRETATPVGRGEQIDRSGTLVVNRPRFDRNAPENSNGNQPHTIPSPTTGRPMQVPPPNANQNRNNNLPPQNQNQFRNANNNGNRNVENRNPTPPMTQTPAQNPNANANQNHENRFGTTLPQVPEKQTPQQNRNMAPGTPVQTHPAPTLSPRQMENPNLLNPNRDNNRNYEPQPVSPQPQTPPAEIRRSEPAVQPPQPAQQQPQRNYEPPARENNPPPQRQQPSENQPAPDRGRDKDKNNQ